MTITSLLPAQSRVIDDALYATVDGLRAITRANGWTGYGGGSPTLETTCRRLARQYPYVNVLRADDRVQVYDRQDDGRVRRKTYKAGSTEARWFWAKYMAAKEAVSAKAEGAGTIPHAS